MMRWLSMHSFALLLLTVMSCALTACAPWSTYPPVEGSKEVVNGNFEPIPELMAEAITYAHFRQRPEGEIAINLPARARPSVYDRVIGQLDLPARPMTTPGEPAYTIEQVRVRGNLAEVDIIYPTRAGGLESATYMLRHELVGGFYVDEARVWRVPVQQPEAHYLAYRPAIRTGEDDADEPLDEATAGVTNDAATDGTDR